MDNLEYALTQLEKSYDITSTHEKSFYDDMEEMWEIFSESTYYHDDVFMEND